MLERFSRWRSVWDTPRLAGCSQGERCPFNFNVGTTDVFRPANTALKPLLPHTMLLRNEAGDVLTNIGTNSVESSEVPRSARLIFNEYGGQYFLTQIWKAGTAGGELIKSPVEIEMASKYSPGQQIALRVVAHR